MKTTWSKIVILVLVSASVLGTAFAFPFFGGGQNGGDDDLIQVRENIFSALENKDFTSWKTSIEEELTEDRFNKMVERHTNMVQVREIRQELRDARQSGNTEMIETFEVELEELGFPISQKMKGKGIGMKGSRNGDCTFS